LSRQLVAELRAAGVTVVDTAALLDISPQRVSQLANS
jgi:predicted transcriptional regulator